MAGQKLFLVLSFPHTPADLETSLARTQFTSTSSTAAAEYSSCSSCFSYFAITHNPAMAATGGAQSSSTQHTALLFAGAIAVRFALAAALPGLPDFLSGRVEISTPVTGFKRCKSSLLSDCTSTDTE